MVRVITFLKVEHFRGYVDPLLGLHFYKFVDIIKVNIKKKYSIADLIIKLSNLRWSHTASPPIRYQPSRENTHITLRKMLFSLPNIKKSKISSPLNLLPSKLSRRSFDLKFPTFWTNLPFTRVSWSTFKQASRNMICKYRKWKTKIKSTKRSRTTCLRKLVSRSGNWGRKLKRWSLSKLLRKSNLKIKGKKNLMEPSESKLVKSWISSAWNKKRN